MQMFINPVFKCYVFSQFFVFLDSDFYQGRGGKMRGKDSNSQFLASLLMVKINKTNEKLPRAGKTSR